MIKKVNDLLAILYLPFVLVWIVLVAGIVKFLNVSVVEALGLGTATGIILATFKDIYQFYFRKAPPDTPTAPTPPPPDLRK
jgi:hypothetical protein